MGTGVGRQRLASAVVFAMAAAAIGASGHDAAAFELKRATNGQTLHWSASEITYVIDPSVEEGVAGGAAAVSSAVGEWTRAADGLRVSTVIGSDEIKPGLDGRNSVIFAPRGFAPAGDALAVTVTSYDEASGAIVDSDIVINGIHAFAVLDPSAHPPKGAHPVATDGTLDDDDSLRRDPFDLAHVVSHETGHTLGLADEKDDSTSLMYAFTMPGDASVRAPENDDLAGLNALYGAASPPSSSGGCGQSSVAGSRTRAADAWSALALAAVAGTRLLTKRRKRAAARITLLMGAVLVAIVTRTGSARSATRPAGPSGDAVARVTNVATSSTDGLFETTIELAPTACRHDPCSYTARAHRWGGTLGGITQRVEGEGAIPHVGEVVDISFARGDFARVQAITTLAATVVEARH